MVTAIGKSRSLYITAGPRQYWVRVISKDNTMWVGVVCHNTGAILWSPSATAAEKMFVIAFLASLNDGG